jgi:hypothetical protein
MSKTELDHFSVLFNRVRELDLVEEIVRQAKQCKTHLMQILNKSNSYLGRDLSTVLRGLLIALKVAIFYWLSYLPFAKRNALWSLLFTEHDWSQ